MPRAKKKIHYIYKTTCLVTGRYYIGMHSTSNLDDGYLGSGKRLRHSIRKYGKENHIREILEYANDRELLALRERAIVTLELIDDVMCMNLVIGGRGGFQPEHRNADLSAALVKREWLWKNDPVWRANRTTSLANIWVGRSHTDETKQKMRLAKVGKCNGQKNSQYGTCWITKDGVNKKIKREMLAPFIEDGWQQGRK